ncbi:excisionase family DNA-binding protein [Aeromicrobium fastidiosum]|uniref:Helix-turn-helix domain-containing protein n=1 Tax=Aeromicrobium fastidiosum TaxID=52699 RepID=A0A641AP87_9ACTN|nr:helix-turn-helix domain-containing protein [Aeromicrobium fastidiosum]
MSRTPSISKDEIFYSVRSAAERSNFSESTIRRAIRDGELQALKVRGSIRIRKSAMDAWLLSGE